jgi:polysaccharide pyruvyl transferase WcaK-like protein
MRSNNIRVALLHHTGGGNLGDDATLDVVVAEIRERWPDAQITALSMNPLDTMASSLFWRVPFSSSGNSIS